MTARATMHTTATCLARALVAATLLLALLPATPAAAAGARVSGRCDFNGDGFHDTVVGAPGDQIDGKRRAGSVHVFYGSDTGVKVKGSQQWSQASPGVPGGPEAYDEFGQAMTCGDYDHNGRSDLAIAHPGERIGSEGYAHGEVTILYGTAKGLTAERAAQWSQASDGVHGSIQNGDSFGMSMASGDFDDDGVADLAVGVPYDGADWGGVHVLYGRATRGIRSANTEYWHQDEVGIADARQSYERCGFTVSSGDFNGDGHDDVAFSCPDEHEPSTVPGQPAEEGAIHLLFGTDGKMRGDDQVLRLRAVDLAAGHLDTGPTDDLLIGGNGWMGVRYGAASDGGVGSAVQVWTPTSEGLTYVGSDGDRFGEALATGDVNGDSYEDVLIGIPAADGVDGVEVGAALLLRGSSTGLTSAGNQTFTQDTSGLASDSAEDEKFGASVALADLNRNGYADAVIGSPDENVVRDGVARSDAGAVHVLRGTGTGLTGAKSRLITQQSDGVPSVAGVSDNFGFSLNQP